jgi:uncharacterized repeat protein (TIGR03843 family)
MPWSSNGTFLAQVSADGLTLPAIYKPFRAERPLWDFPDGLYRREVAAYELDRALGWRLVPETVVREEGPLGIGSLQRFVDADFTQHYFTLLEQPRFHPALRTIAVFDLLVNNADRKGGHCLVDGSGWVWGIDHGLTFHVQPKLRTVIWDFADEPIAAELVSDIERVLRDGLPGSLGEVLHPDELAAVSQRMKAVTRRPVYPAPRSGRPYPWPLV